MNAKDLRQLAEKQFDKKEVNRIGDALINYASKEAERGLFECSARFENGNTYSDEFYVWRLERIEGQKIAEYLEQKGFTLEKRHGAAGTYLVIKW